MKRIAPTFAALGQGVDGANAEGAIKSAGTLGQLFADAEVFWRAKQRADAEAWALAARVQAQSIERAARSGQWNLVKPAMATLGQQCQSCHTAYRDPFADGSFRIKVVGK
jgi:cytochrome c556